MKSILLVTMFVLGIATTTSCQKEKAKPTVDFEYQCGICTGTSGVVFENKSKEATSFRWDFDDGTSTTEVNPTKTLGSGVHTVKLTAIGDGGTATISKEVGIW